MSIRSLKEKLLNLETELEQSQMKVKKILASRSLQTTSELIYCYFTYSIVLNYMKQTSHLIMGNFHLVNISDQNMQSPVILLKINSKTEFNFSGKYKLANKENQAYNFQWERVMIDDLDPATHYCFKPTENDVLRPNELLSFQSFQVVIPLDASINIEGFTYFNQNNDGVPALNSIDISV